MRAWLADADAHAAMCRALCAELDVPDWLMASVYARRRWYLIPDVAYYRAAIRESGFESGFALGTFIREYFENQVHLLYENSTFITQFFPKIRMECSENGDKADCAHCTQFAGACALKFA
jgi:hypothetical protein